MGFYVRKSVSVGPFRFNFSNSGVGVSAGVKGFRVGTGPRGNYISVGSNGLYYRASLPPFSALTNSGPRGNSPTQHPQSGQAHNTSGQPGHPPNPTAQPKQAQPHAPNPGNAPAPNVRPSSHWSVGPMVSIQSAPVSSMQDMSSKDLLDELNTKNSRPNYWIFVAIAGIVGLFVAAQTMPPWAIGLSALLIAALAAYVSVRDTVAKTSVLGYHLDPANEHAYQTLHSAFSVLASCHKGWRIDAQGAVRDRKYQAGAGAVIERKAATFGMGLPPYVKSNVDVPFVKAGSTSLYFMPDHVLVYSQGAFGSIAYKNLQFAGKSTRFIESSGVPGDSQIVDKTWRYVNKSGGPDRRFNSNTEIPIVLYEELHFQSASGLNEVFQASKHSISTNIQTALQGMTHVLP